MSTIARSSLRAYVRTKEDVEVNVEEKGEEELDLLSDPLALANTGILLSNKRGDGKVVFNLRELPLHSEWRTSAGHTVSRVSRRDVLICDVTGQPHTIDVPSETLLTILYLPDTVLQAIWLHLIPTEYNQSVPADIARCRLVCRQWARMLEKMVVYERRLGIKFAPAPPARVPSQPPVRVRSIFDSDADFFDDDDGEEDDGQVNDYDYDGPSLDPGRTTFSLLLLLASSRPKPPPARGILKRPGDTKAKGKKSVRWAGLDGDENGDEDDEARELRARESVRRKLAEGGELSRRFLASFFGWSGKHHGHLRGSKRDSGDEGGDDESADSDLGDAEDGLGSDPDIAAAEEAWYRANVFENQSRNLTRLKELEMRLEEMVRSKTRLRAKRQTKEVGEEDSSPLPEGKGKEVASLAEETEQDQAKREEDEKREQEPRMGEAAVVVDAEGWAASPAYVSPPEASPDEAREGLDGPGGHQKRRRRDSLTGLLSSMSGARKKLLSR